MNLRPLWMLALTAALSAEASAQQFVYPAKGQSPAGRIKILDYVAAHDIGRAINPTMVEGQIVGGVAMGLGAVLGEELIYENGRPVNPASLRWENN